MSKNKLCAITCSLCQVHKDKLNQNSDGPSVPFKPPSSLPSKPLNPPSSPPSPLSLPLKPPGGLKGDLKGGLKPLRPKAWGPYSERASTILAQQGRDDERH